MKNILETLEQEYNRLGAVLDSFFTKARGASEVVRAAELYKRILFLKIQALKRKRGPAEVPKASEEVVSVKDLQQRYGIKSRQGITTWLARNLDAINRQSKMPVQKVGKYWQISVSALPVIDELRRGDKER